VQGCEVLYDEVWGVIPLVDGSEEQLDSLPRLTVVGLPLSNSSVVYYYVYGSVLAAFDLCDEAIEILDLVSAEFYNDDIIMGIVQESYTVCEILGTE